MQEYYDADERNLNGVADFHVLDVMQLRSTLVQEIRTNVFQFYLGSGLCGKSKTHAY